MHVQVGSKRAYHESSEDLKSLAEHDKDLSLTNQVRTLFNCTHYTLTKSIKRSLSSLILMGSATTVSFLTSTS